MPKVSIKSREQLTAFRWLPDGGEIGSWQEFLSKEIISGSIFIARLIYKVG